MRNHSKKPWRKLNVLTWKESWKLSVLSPWLRSKNNAIFRAPMPKKDLPERPVAPELPEEEEAVVTARTAVSPKRECIVPATMTITPFMSETWVSELLRLNSAVTLSSTETSRKWELLKTNKKDPEDSAMSNSKTRTLLSKPLLETEPTWTEERSESPKSKRKRESPEKKRENDFFLFKLKNIHIIISQSIFFFHRLSLFGFQDHGFCHVVGLVDSHQLIAQFEHMASKTHNNELNKISLLKHFLSSV